MSDTFTPGDAYHDKGACASAGKCTVLVCPHQPSIGDEIIKPKMAADGGYHMRCCDCGLVHRLDFTLTLNDVEVDPRKVRLELRVFRDEEKTAIARGTIPGASSLGLISPHNGPYDAPATWLHKTPGK